MLLRALVDDHRQTVVMVTHVPTAAAYADRVLLLTDGRVVDDMTGGITATVVAARIAERETLPAEAAVEQQC
ncbi:hypothetical protein MCAG_03385 [Micromonospora sp. ATCC 39149]|nr:hypothetical protein MCAG_03385 [Micromonospora sp. ATCC 39149]